MGKNKTGTEVESTEVIKEAIEDVSLNDTITLDEDTTLGSSKELETATDDLNHVSEETKLDVWDQSDESFKEDWEDEENFLDEFTEEDIVRLEELTSYKFINTTDKEVIKERTILANTYVSYLINKVLNEKVILTKHSNIKSINFKYWE